MTSISNLIKALGGLDPTQKSHISSMMKDMLTAKREARIKPIKLNITNKQQYQSEISTIKSSIVNIQSALSKIGVLKDDFAKLPEFVIDKSANAPDGVKFEVLNLANNTTRPYTLEVSIPDFQHDNNIIVKINKSEIVLDKNDTSVGKMQKIANALETIDADVKIHHNSSGFSIKAYSKDKIDYSATVENSDRNARDYIYFRDHNIEPNHTVVKIIGDLANPTSAHAIYNSDLKFNFSKLNDQYLEFLDYKINGSQRVLVINRITHELKGDIPNIEKTDQKFDKDFELKILYRSNASKEILKEVPIAVKKDDTLDTILKKIQDTGLIASIKDNKIVIHNKKDAWLDIHEIRDAMQKSDLAKFDKLNWDFTNNIAISSNEVADVDGYFIRVQPDMVGNVTEIQKNFTEGVDEAAKNIEEVMAAVKELDNTVNKMRTQVDEKTDISKINYKDIDGDYFIHSIYQDLLSLLAKYGFNISNGALHHNNPKFLERITGNANIIDTKGGNAKFIYIDANNITKPKKFDMSVEWDGKNIKSVKSPDINDKDITVKDRKIHIKNIGSISTEPGVTNIKSQVKPGMKADMNQYLNQTLNSLQDKSSRISNELADEHSRLREAKQENEAVSEDIKQKFANLRSNMARALSTEQAIKNIMKEDND